MAVSFDLLVGAVLTVFGWIGLLIAVVHARRVIARLTTPRGTGAETDPGETGPNGDE